MNKFAQKFRLEELAVARYAHWTVSIRPVQITLGSLVISLNRECNRLGLITETESKEMAVVFSDVEAALKDLIDHEKINYLGLMMVDDHVHFHVIPRYSGVRTLGTHELTDTHWPGPPDVSSGTNDEALIQSLRENLTDTLKGKGAAQ